MDKIDLKESSNVWQDMAIIHSFVVWLPHNKVNKGSKASLWRRFIDKLKPGNNG